MYCLRSGCSASATRIYHASPLRACSVIATNIYLCLPWGLVVLSLRRFSYVFPEGPTPMHCYARLSLQETHALCKYLYIELNQEKLILNYIFH